MDQLLITVIVLIFPGIICAIIFDKITSHSKWTSFKFSLYSLVLGIFCYTLLQTVYFFIDAIKILACGGSWTWLTIWNAALRPDDALSGKEVVLATLCAPLVAFFSSFLVNHKVFNKIAKRLKISTKFGDENLFSYYLNSPSVRWTYVRDEEQGITYFGEIASFSEGENHHELVLLDVSVYNTETSKLLYEVPSTYINKPFGSLVIEAALP